MSTFMKANPTYDMTKIIDTEVILNFVPRWPVFINLITACICLGLSAIYHNFHYMGKYINKKLATLDYGGICLLIMGSAIPPSVYPFACKPTHETSLVFMLLVTISCGGGFLLLLNSRFASSECRPLRSIMFVSLGISAAAPLAYLSFQDDKVNLSYFSFAPYWFGGFFYIFGAILYGTRTPERFFVGKLNFIGSSHQIFHVCVILGAYFHF